MVVNEGAAVRGSDARVLASAFLAGFGVLERPYGVVTGTAVAGDEGPPVSAVGDEFGLSLVEWGETGVFRVVFIEEVLPAVLVVAEGVSTERE